MPWTAPVYSGGVLWKDLPDETTPLDAADLNTEENAEAMYAVQVGQSVVNYFERGTFNARYYGVKADGKTITDAVVNGNQLSSPSTQFSDVTLDRGKLVVVVGGGAGGHHYTTISSVAGGVATLAAAAGTNIAAGGEVFYATNDTVAWQACISAAELVNGTVEVPDGDSGLNAALVINTALKVRGQGVKDIYGSDGTLGGAGSMNAAAFPSVAPYLKGSVLVQCAANTDIIQCTVAGQAAHFEKFGLRFAGRYLTTGHGLNCAPANGYGNVGGNLIDVHVFGQDGNHYGILGVATMNQRHQGLRTYGGGGIRLFTGTAPGQPGNITADDCFFNTYIGGTAHAAHIDSSGAQPFTACTFTNWDPQVNVPAPALPAIYPVPTNVQKVLATTNPTAMNSMQFFAAMGQSQVAGSNATYPSGPNCSRTNDPQNCSVGNPAMATPASGVAVQNLTGKPMVPINQFLLQPLAAASATTTINQAGGTAVGATSVVLTSVAGVAVGSVLQIDTGANMEFSIVTSVVGNTVGLFSTTGWGLAEAHANGATVAVGAAMVVQEVNSSNAWPGRRFGMEARPIGLSPQIVSMPAVVIGASAWYKLTWGNATRTWTDYTAATG